MRQGELRLRATGPSGPRAAALAHPLGEWKDGGATGGARAGVGQGEPGGRELPAFPGVGRAGDAGQRCDLRCETGLATGR